MSSNVVLSKYKRFDFDDMVRLAIDSPEEFSKRRAMLLEEAIQSSRDRQSSRRLQLRIEADAMTEWTPDQAAKNFAKHVRQIIG